MESSQVEQELSWYIRMTQPPAIAKGLALKMKILTLVILIEYRYKDNSNRYALLLSVVCNIEYSKGLKY
jgi:hypothetical protein